MRTTILLAIMFPVQLLGQDWALLNPAYKYNYSDDGTDTIRSQVFVTDIDTLGPDSFRYGLNRVAQICDTCGTDPSSMFILPDAPQWLGGEVIRYGDTWHFLNGTSRVILPLAPFGATWLFDTLNAVSAEMLSTVDALTFGIPDQHRTISLSDGGELLLSRDHGILYWNTGHRLIGINGPQLGRTVPSLAEFFPYVPGDIVEYEKWHGGCDGLGGCEGVSIEFKFTVEDGANTDSAIVHDGWMVAHRDWYFQLGGPGSNMEHVHSYTNNAGTWIAGIPELPWAELLFSHPGQLIQRGYFLDQNHVVPNYCIAKHGLDMAGRYTIGCSAFERGEGAVGHFFFSDPPKEPSGMMTLYGPEDWCYPGDGSPCGVTYVAGSGMTGFTGNYFERGEHYLLRGMVLGGDTAHGSITDDSIILSVPDLQADAQLQLAPNPAQDHLIVVASVGDMGPLMLIDPLGRTLHTLSVLPGQRTDIDVSGLPTGTYFLYASLTGIAQRFVITR